MAVQFNDAGQALVGFNPSATHTVVADGADCYVLAMGAVSSASDKVSGVTCNGVAMTRIRADGLGLNSLVTYVYGLAIGNKTNETQTIVWTFASSDVGMRAVGRTFKGVNQSSPIADDDGVSNGFATSPVSFPALTAPSGSMSADFMAIDDEARSLTPTTGQTESGTQGNEIQHRSAASRKADSTSMSWGFSGGGTQIATGSVVVLNPVTVAPVITGPSGAATGPTQGNAQATTDAATGAMYYLPRVGGSAALAAAIKAGGVRKPISAIGAAIQALTGLTTNATNAVDIVHDGTDAGQFSNVVTATIAPQTLASSGSPAAQTGTAGGSFTWTGAAPATFITNSGNGSGAWSIVSSAGFTVAPSINTTTGVLSGGTLAGAGSYSPQVRYTDSSTVPSAQTVTFTLGLMVSGGGGGGDTTPPTMSAASVTGGTLSATGSITSNEAGTLWAKMDGSATATDPGAGSETGAGWTSQSMTASANAVNFGTQPAGTRYGHFIGVDAAGNRAAVVNASGTVTSGVGTYTAQTDIIAVAGIALANTLVYFTWCPSGRPGSITSPVNGSTTTDSTGRATISHAVAGDGFVVIGTRPGPVVSNDRVFAQFLTLA